MKRKPRQTKRERKAGPQEPRRIVRGAEAAEIMNAMLSEAVKPHRQEIAEAWGERGEIPIVVHKPSVETLKVLPNLGWKMGQAVFSMALQHFLDVFGDVDTVTGPWAERDRSGDDSMPVFLFWGSGTLLLNMTPGKGWSIEPGSTDVEMFN